jgi:hypothetical protein
MISTAWFHQRDDQKVTYRSNLGPPRLGCLSLHFRQSDFVATLEFAVGRCVEHGLPLLPLLGEARDRRLRSHETCVRVDVEYVRDG